MASPVFDYLSEYEPPIPVIELEVTNRNNTEYQRATFIIDSGADNTVISKTLFDILDLNYSGVRGATGHIEERYTSMVKLKFPFGVDRIIEVIVEPNLTENLLGRDVINQWLVILDGPKQKTSIEQSR